MRNVKESQLRKSIVMDASEFDQVVRKATDQDVTVHYEMEGLWYDTEDGEEISNEHMCSLLSLYFGVAVASIHVDDCNQTGVWITYSDDKIRMKQYYPDSDELWQYTIKGESCECKCNVFHHVYDGQNINVVCNCCGRSIATIKPEYIEEELKKGTWK